MEESIVDRINEDLSLNELGEILRTTFARIYKKLDEEEDIYRPICIVNSLGDEEYNVDVRFISGSSHNTGAVWDSIYYI